MAVHIAHRGHLPNEPIYESLCAACNSLFTYGASDGKMFFGPFGADFIEILCPVCGKACHSPVR